MLKLRRITNGETWIPQVDGLRFIAILSVMLFHVSGEVAERGPRLIHVAPSDMPLYHWLANGDRGVPLFFVLSGYVLARPFYQWYRLNKRPVVLKKYFIRRLTRLEPPYILSLIIFSLAFHLAYHVPWNILGIHFAASAVYLHNLIYPWNPSFNFVTWSLEIEVQFYILAPLIGILFKIDSLTRRCVIFSALTVVGCFIGAWLPGPPVTLLAYAGFFPAGFLLAEVLENPNRSRKQSYLWDVLGLALWITFFWLPYSLTVRAFLPLIIFPIYVMAFYGKLTSRILAIPFIAITGGMCYSIYLMHTLLMSLTFRLVKHITFHNDILTSWVQIILVIAMILALATIYFVLIERPCMNPHWPQDLMDRLRGRRPKPDPRTAATT
jgi:peptidoglycan/LPS O-acetylase OafA/YrhL